MQARANYMSSVKSLLKGILGYFRLKKALRNNPDPLIVVGASGVFQDKWIPTDVNTLNLLKPATWKLFFKENSISAILAEHVWEHLSPEDGLIAAKTCFRFLKKGGYVRIAVPDGYHNKAEYINYVKPGGTGMGADDHKVLYNYKSLSQTFQDAGFQIKLLEYFDENGKFHYTEWDKNDGMIHRSMRYDERNINNELNYTSLILDAIR